MTKLYELSQQLIGLSHLMESGEMDAETLQDTLDGLEGELEQKAEGLLSYVANIGSDVAAVDAEIKRLQARKATKVNQQESLREYLRTNMAVAGIKKITCPLFSVTLSKGKPMVVVDNERLVPKKYKKTIPASTQIIKADLLKGVKKGSVPGAHLGESKQSLLIK